MNDSLWSDLPASSTYIDNTTFIIEAILKAQENKETQVDIYGWIDPQTLKSLSEHGYIFRTHNDLTSIQTGCNLKVLGVHTAET